MPFDFTEYVDPARELGQLCKKVGWPPDEEAAMRNATSRIYYAALHGAKCFIEMVDGKQLSQVGGTHEVVWNEFKNKGPSRNEVFARAEKLKKWRTWADYDPPEKTPPTSADEVFDEVEKLQAALRSMAGQNANKCPFLTKNPIKLS